MIFSADPSSRRRMAKRQAGRSLRTARRSGFGFSESWKDNLGDTGACGGKIPHGSGHVAK
ncbi:hypothetical protein RGR602_CH01471 [Rhizobium gallicum bv. gallicum R602sp]|uniref:Uncharacterized protein n=1 Tax=Rhizobium gallicum bv. gallicum R602sp TaxID=1041138 RepID=A0A0B4X2T9_9HYPH|nr:hypothetical protein RGR602_CH01471 [Rhizobium gallicum bv. gallicum R602sp]